MIWCPSRIGDTVAEMALRDVKGDVWNVFIRDFYRYVAMRPGRQTTGVGRQDGTTDVGRHPPGRQGNASKALHLNHAQSGEKGLKEASARHANRNSVANATNFREKR